MGVVETVGAEKFPEQGHMVGKRVQVCFHYDTGRKFKATVLRDDRENPWIMLLRLDDGRVVRSVECQWTHLDELLDDSEPTPTLADYVNKINTRVMAGGPLSPFVVHNLEQAAAKARDEFNSRDIDLDDPETARVLAAFCDYVGENLVATLRSSSFHIVIETPDDVARLIRGLTEVTGGTCAAIVERHGGRAMSDPTVEPDNTPGPEEPTNDLDPGRIGMQRVGRRTTEPEGIDSDGPNVWLISSLADGNGVCHGCGCIVHRHWAEAHQNVCPAPRPTRADVEADIAQEDDV